MTHPMIRKILTIALQVVTYLPGEGALCPFCHERMPTTSTYYRDPVVVKRYHLCNQCQWNFHSVEQIPLVVESTPIPQIHPKRCKFKSKRR